MSQFGVLIAIHSLTSFEASASRTRHREALTDLTVKNNVVDTWLHK